LSNSTFPLDGDALGAAALPGVAAPLRSRLVAVGLTAALAATTLVVWHTPSLRQNVVDSALEAAPLPRTVEDGVREITGTRPGTRAESAEQASRTQIRSTLTALATALTNGDRQAARQLARQVLSAAEDEPQVGRMLADIGLTMDDLLRVAATGSARLTEEGAVTEQVADRNPADDGGQGAAAGVPQDDDAGVSPPGTTESTPEGAQPPVAVPAPPTPKAPTHCWEFTWQQDAQAVYAADPQDPYGLDGNPGPRDDDGIACRNLPDDPSRPASTPLWPFVVTAPSREEVLNPDTTYFGVFAPEAPFHFAEVDGMAADIEHMPDSVTWFAGWDQDFRPEAADNAWKRGMFPIVSWESRPQVTPMGPESDNAVNSEYQLADIVAGTYDEYIRSYAEDVAAYRLPVGLRFDHEMNGIWYPWAEQVNGNRPGEFVAAWRHVHDIFDEEGATNAIWIWAPNVVEFPQAQPLPELYPGDEYVDFAGLTGYYRKPVPGKAATFQNTYGRSLDAVRAAAPGKKILLTEVGATETGGNKVAWVTSFFEQLPNHPDVVGFTWFQRQVTAIPIGESQPVTNDWRITSSPEATLAFRTGIRDPRYGEGSPAQTKTPLPEIPPATEPLPSPTEAVAAATEPDPTPTGPDPTPTPATAPTTEPTEPTEPTPLSRSAA
jgi:hypothetical protein